MLIESARLRMMLISWQLASCKTSPEEMKAHIQGRPACNVQAVSVVLRFIKLYQAPSATIQNL